MVLSLCSFLLLLQPFAAQDLPLGVPQLQLQMGDKKPSTLKSLAYDVEIMGFLAQTTVTLTVEDPDSQNQEASFLVQLPPHSTVDGFQLGIKKTMVDGVIQEKNLARMGFEREKRRRVDPGLIEMVGHNIYQIRVFPLRKNLSRTLSFRYLTPLDHTNRYSLDLTQIDKQTKISVRFKQRDGITPLVQVFHGKKWIQKNQSYEWSISEKGPFEEPLVLHWQEGDLPAVMLAQDASGWHFGLRQKYSPTLGDPLPSPKTVAVFWDASQSRNRNQIALETEALWRLLAFRNPEKVAFIAFRDRQEAPIFFPNSVQGKRDLKATIETMIYDGGTNLHGLKLPDDVGPDETWLFSDGFDTIGMPQGEVLTGVLTFSFSASPLAKWAYLDALSNAKGGKAMHWKNPTEEELFQCFRSQIKKVDEIQPLRGYLETSHLSHVKATQTLLVGGRASTNPKGFKYYAGRQKGMLLGVTVDVSHLPDGSEWLRRFTAARELENLQLFPDQNQNEIMSLGETHQFVTPHTTMIVFETLRQYEINGLVPPDNAPFDVSKMRDLTPSAERIKYLKKRYFSKVARLWNQKYKREISRAALTADELNDRLPARDPWEVLTTIPSVQSDSINIGGNESNASWVIDGVEFVASSGASSSYLDFGAFERMGVTTEVIEDQNQDHGTPPESQSILDWQDVKKAVSQIKKSDVPYQQYLALKPHYQDSPAYHYQMAQFFLEQDQKVLALRVATNLLEQGWQDDRLLFAAGMFFHAMGEFDFAEAVYRDLMKQRREWPHTRMFFAQIQRERAILLEATDKPLAMGYYLAAFDQYQYLINKPWGPLDDLELESFLLENRFPYIIVPMIEEALWLQGRLAALGEGVSLVLPEGIAASPDDIKADFRVLVWWNDDNAEFQLQVKEPCGHLVTNSYYSHNSGGYFMDHRQGLGPDGYVHRSAKEGTYEIQTVFQNNVYSNLLGPVYLKTELWLRYGYPDEAYQVKVHRLEVPNYYHPVKLEHIHWPPN